ncbi:family 20 glycosylhydrolase [Pseudopedobacter beijingensis]|uniref:beta-N-acetylhexosaminidase n=1 Tax=Pseudopedobacter beijingensis TaxID=1207056 RepID=A0ABW4I8V1_9SPHI
MNYIKPLNRIILVLLLSAIGGYSFSQSERTASFSYKMEIKSVQPDSPISTFILTNNSKNVLPNQGWDIYFNSIKYPGIMINDTNKYQINHVNGDLYRLSPRKEFAELKPGKTMKIDITLRFMRNISDFPSGFYIVWNSDPAKVYTIKNIDPDYASLLIDDSQVAETVYNQNLSLLKTPVQQSVKVFPTPNTYQEKGFSFKLDANVKIIAPAIFKNEAELLSSDLYKLLGEKPQVITSGSGKAIVLKKVNLKGEAYQIDINKDQIVVSAGSAAGVFYGIQSLNTLFPPNVWSHKQSVINIPAVSVQDSPRFEYRAFMLDIARNFQTKKELFKVLDIMALYKLNVLHFHFNDDEGWRVEIPGLPELTEVGGQRGHSLDNNSHLPPSHGSGPDINTLPGSGYYSRKEFIEILKYAKSRHIRIIPEIETPGHARAAIKAMEVRYNRLMKEGKKEEAKEYLLSDKDDQSQYKSVQGWNDNVINVAMPSVYRFVEKTVVELIKMYKEAEAPLSTVHMGGDEVPIGVWEKSEIVKQFLEQNNELKTSDDLWKYFFTKVNEILNKHQLYLSGWEEIGMKKVIVDGKKRMVVDTSMVKYGFQTDVWNNVYGTGAEDLAYKLANAGYKVVLSNVTNMYLDMAYNKSFTEPGMYWGGYIDIDKPFYFIPNDYFKNFKEDEDGNHIPPSALKDKNRLTPFGRSNIIGLQSALWSENVASSQRLEYMLLPKLLSFAERAWSTDPKWVMEQDSVKSDQLYNKDWAAFVSTLWNRELPRLNYYKGGYNYRVPAPGVIIKEGKVFANAQSQKFIIRYTTDNIEPNVNSLVYKDGLSTKGNLAFKVFTPDGRFSKTVRIVNK